MNAKGSSDDQPDKLVVFIKAHLTLHKVMQGVYSVKLAPMILLYLKFFRVFFSMSVE